MMRSMTENANKCTENVQVFHIARHNFFVRI